MMPLFILYGGEIVIAIIAARIAFWFLRSRPISLPPDPPPDGPGPRGTPKAVLEPAASGAPEPLHLPDAAPAPPVASPERRAA